ncbi:MAG: UDP-2,3-diacylglucosamine diphosphatase [Epsilonproteobacteria bacterium]|nr:MAG: UDP-2,3-diacylglucosamine diphosphatase [Campylobacterota bacterium]
MTKIHDAIFIADSHYNSSRTQLENLLQTIKNSDTKNIFLVGDIFDFLSNDISYFRQKNNKIINIINSLSKQKNIIYLEGNHDFNIKDIFPDCRVVTREQQPYMFVLNEKKVALSHGDIFTAILYNIYTKLIRHKYIGKILNKIDVCGFISKIVEQKLKTKKICKEIKDFDTFAKKRLKFYDKYKADIVVEAHYHQGKRYKNYINLPSFACSKTYFTQEDMY